MKRFIEEWQQGDLLKEVLFVSDAQVKETKAGKAYLDLKLRDRTGEVAAKYWDYNAEKDGKPQAGECWGIIGAVESYQGKTQLKVSSIHQLEPDDPRIVQSDFLPVSQQDVQTLFEKLAYKRFANMEDCISRFVSFVLADPVIQKAIVRSPAAKGNHHAYIGGLMEHIANLCDLVDVVCAVYLNRYTYRLDRYVMLAAAVFHDIGKIWELEAAMSVDYTLPGKLLGHIPMGYEFIGDKWSEFDDHGPLTEEDRARFLHLQHLILSHHGRMEWGSPVTPKSAEAIVFHHLDMIDSRMGGVLALLAGNPQLDAQGFTPWTKQFDGPLYCGARPKSGMTES